VPGAFRARVVGTSALGALARIELVDRDGRAVSAELPREVRERLQLATGDEVYVRPTRVRVFAGAEKAQS
jgi:hypothetical protein